MPDSYPFYHSLVDQLAAKVITRIAQDGVAMEDAVKEAIHFAGLDRQQVIHLCFTLQEYGLVANNDPKNYFYTPREMGKAFPSVDNGYVVYASKKELDPVFAAIEELKSIGFTNQEITDINPELNNILSLVDEFEHKYHNVMNGQPEMQMAAGLISSRQVKAQAVDVEKPTPDNINNVLNDQPADTAAPSPAPAPEAPTEDTPTDTGGDETFFEDEEGAAPEAGGATVTISPSPADLKDKISKAPQWSVENILSIDKAKAYYEKMKKDLEDIVLNDKITIGEELMKEYNDARSSIDEAINKIDDAQKDTKKLEEKQDDLEQQYEEVPEGDKPTESLIANEEAPAPPAEPAPAPEPLPAK